jgi:hypothetical protein
MSATFGASTLPVLPQQRVRLTKQMLGNQTRKSILYLDQNFLSAVQRGAERWVDEPMAKITELLNLQLLAIPYSSTHIAEADLNGKYRDDLVQFIQRISRGHRFEPYWRVEETQIVKAFDAFLDKDPAAYEKEDRDALPPSVHDWDGDYSISVSSAATGVERRSFYKQKALTELLRVLPQWANKGRTFEKDITLEINDSARLLVDNYARKVARLMTGDLSALLGSPINSTIVETMLHVAQAKNADLATIGAFFQSTHFAAVPAVQLSARLFSAYKATLRLSKTSPDPASKRTRSRLSGFSSDVQHAATYAPYCDGYFTDNVMARLMREKRVSVKGDFGCKVFSTRSMDDFLAWLEGIKSRMTQEHADDLSWAYPRYRNLFRKGRCC